MKRVSHLAGVCVLATVVAVAPAQAGGLYINEFATASMGAAGAGAQAIANDASTAFHNPAGMTHLEGSALSLGAGLGVVQTEFDPADDTPIPGNDGGNQGGVAPVLSSHYVHSVSDRWRAGVNVISVSGALLDPDSGWAGRYQVDEVSVLTLSLNPTVAYRINDWVSLGVGVLAMYARLDMDVSAPPPDGDGKVELDSLDDFEVGWNAGVLFDLCPGTRLGIVYSSELDTKFSGDVRLVPGKIPAEIETAIDTGLPLPQLLRVGLYHELNDRFALLSTVGWEDWSALENQFVSLEQGSTAIPRGWEDTWHFALGLQYRPDDVWMVQTGLAYDTSPVDTEDRTADLPIDRQIRVALGAQYQWSEDLNVGASFVYANYGDAEIDNDLLKGDYSSNNIFFLAFNADWRWLPTG